MEISATYGVINVIVGLFWYVLFAYGLTLVMNNRTKTIGQIVILTLFNVSILQLSISYSIVYGSNILTKKIIWVGMLGAVASLYFLASHLLHLKKDRQLNVLTKDVKERYLLAISLTLGVYAVATAINRILSI